MVEIAIIHHVLNEQHGLQLSKLQEQVLRVTVELDRNERGP